MQKWKIKNEPVIVLKPVKASEQQISLETIAALYYDHLCRLDLKPTDVDLSKQKRGSK